LALPAPIILQPQSFPIFIIVFILPPTIAETVSPTTFKPPAVTELEFDLTTLQTPPPIIAQLAKHILLQKPPTRVD